MTWAWILSTVGMVVFGGAWLWTLRALFRAEEERDALVDSSLNGGWDE